MMGVGQDHGRPAAGRRRSGGPSSTATSDRGPHGPHRARDLRGRRRGRLPRSRSARRCARPLGRARARRDRRRRRRGARRPNRELLRDLARRTVTWCGSRRRPAVLAAAGRQRGPPPAARRRPGRHPRAASTAEREAALRARWPTIVDRRAAGDRALDVGQVAGRPCRRRRSTERPRDHASAVARLAAGPRPTTCSVGRPGAVERAWPTCCPAGGRRAAVVTQAGHRGRRRPRASSTAPSLHRRRRASQDPGHGRGAVPGLVARGA